MPDTDITVVVAFKEDEKRLLECLTQLVFHAGTVNLHIIVVGKAGEVSQQWARSNRFNVQFVEVPEKRWTPELWGLGLARACGQIVAFIESSCVPAANWVSRLLELHQKHDAAGIGGAIEPEEAMTAVGWAVYFLRYAPYMLPFEPQWDVQIPGDNCSYKRKPLLGAGVNIEKGFWEYVVNKRLLAIGERTLLTPELQVTARTERQVRDFLFERFYHGTRFGKDRATMMNLPKRVAYGAGAVAAAPVLLGKRWSQVRSKKRYLDQFLRALPWMMLFAASWSLGELCGAWQAFYSKSS